MFAYVAARRRLTSTPSLVFELKYFSCDEKRLQLCSSGNWEIKVTVRCDKLIIEDKTPSTSLNVSRDLIHGFWYKFCRVFQQCNLNWTRSNKVIRNYWQNYRKDIDRS